MSFWRNYYHLVWATKNREPFIDPRLKEPLYSYLIGKAAKLGVYVYAIGGISDHIHMVVAIPPKQSVSEVVKGLKGASSHYVNHVLHHESKFAWQRGYGCLTMGESQRANAVAYVQNQEQHHAENTTNAWLERTPESEEGPSPTENLRNENPRAVHEVGAGYEENLEPYF